MIDGRVAAVVVTRNRVGMLRECLAALEAQTRPLDAVIVVDNASSDGTARAVRDDHPQASLVRLDANVGATGGFHAGLRAALDRGADWIWLLDDDAIARPDALERLVHALDRSLELAPPAVLAGRVVWKDGLAHPMNMPIVRRRDVAALVRAAGAGLLPLRATSWIGMLVARGAVERHGLPNREYFFQADDIEYSARILRTEAGYLVPSSVVEHRTARPHTTLRDADELRFYYHLRNTLFMIRGSAWERHEKPAWRWVALESAVRFLGENRVSPASVRIVARALRAGLGPHDAS